MKSRLTVRPGPPGPTFDGDPAIREDKTIERRQRWPRFVRGPQNDPTNMDGQNPRQGHMPHDGTDTTSHDGDVTSGGIGVGIAVAWDGSNRRGGRTYGRRRTDIVRYHRSIDPRTGILSSDGLVYINLGTCSTDKVWEMRSIILTYQDPWTVGPTGSQAAVFVGQCNPGQGPRLVDLTLMGIAIPAAVSWSHDQQLVYGGQDLYVCINDPQASPGLYQAQADVCEYNWEAYRMRQL